VRNLTECDDGSGKKGALRYSRRLDRPGPHGGPQGRFVSLDGLTLGDGVPGARKVGGRVLDGAKIVLWKERDCRNPGVGRR